MEVTILDEHFMKPATHCQSQIVIARRPPTETFAKPTDISAAVPQVGHEVSRKKLKWYLQLRWNFRSIHATKELMLSGPFIHLPANGEGWSFCYFNIKSGLHLKRLRNHDLTCSWLKGLLVVLHSIQWGSVQQALRRMKLKSCGNLHVYNSCRTCFLHIDIFHDIKTIWETWKNRLLNRSCRHRWCWEILHLPFVLPASNTSKN